MHSKFLSIFKSRKPVEMKDLSVVHQKKEMYIGCSGGQGHNTSLRGIIYEDQLDPQTEITMYDAKLYSSESNTKRDQLEQGFRIQYDRIFGEFIREIVEKTPLPVLPLHEKIQKEIENLNNQSMGQNKRPLQRPYIDMLLDVYDIGYESAAIWNVLQREDNAFELRKLIKLQKLSDLQNYANVKNYFLTKLINANELGIPYTGIVSTQAMALPALCDAVIQYNAKHSPKILINQFFTDLPTAGAVHFLEVLAGLNKQQRQVMVLNGVALAKFIKNSKNMEKHNLLKPPFAGIKDIAPENNPMVRPGFKKTYDITTMSELPYKENGQKSHQSLQPDDIVASIMLGSQAGADTIKYIEKLRTTADYIFVFGGKKFEEEVKQLEAQDEEEVEYVDLHTENTNRTFDEKNISKKAKIILLENQDDDTIAPIMFRANLIVVRSGGLSIMELMALFAAYQAQGRKIIFIHHKDSPNLCLTSGISWEDANGNELILYLTPKGIHVIKTTPEKVVEDIKLDTNDLNRLLNFIAALESYVKKNSAAFTFKPGPKEAVKKLHSILNKQLLNLLSNDESHESLLLTDVDIKHLMSDEELIAIIFKYMHMIDKEDIKQINTALQQFGGIKSLNIINVNTTEEENGFDLASIIEKDQLDATPTLKLRS